MLSHISDRISFISLLVVVVLLPLFFVPFTKIPVENSKGLLLVVGLSVAVIFWAIARFFDGKITLPRSAFLLSSLAVVVVYLLAAIFSSARDMSFFGIMFDAGSFAFVFSAMLLMFASAVILRDPYKARTVFFGLLFSGGIVLVFQVLRLFMPEFLSLGLLGAKTDNLLGSWNALGFFAGFFVLLALLEVELFETNPRTKWLLGFLTVLALGIIAAVNWSFIWALLGVFSLVVFVYKVSSASKENENINVYFPIFSFSIVIISLLFFISGRFIGGVLPDRLGVFNLEVRPSLSGTASVVKQDFTKNPVLGTGPNRFGELWARHKPLVVNETRYWNTYFNSGSGLIPTLLSSAGFLGLLAWLIFFLTFIVSGAKSVFAHLSLVSSGLNRQMAIFSLASFYLFVASFLYPTGPVLFLLALVLAGAFVGLSSLNHPSREISISFLNNPRKSFFFMLLLILIMIIAPAACFKYVERFASIPYFQKALAATEILAAESNLGRALSLHVNDLYLRTYAQIELLKIGSIVGKGSLSEADKADMQKSFEQAISAAVAAINYNGGNYLNVEVLGLIYETVAPFVENRAEAMTKALEAYNAAAVFNPNNPGLRLAIARVHAANKNYKEAKDFANQALALKPDLIDTLVVLSQIAKATGNNSEALAYAKQALERAPSNQDLINYVNSFGRGEVVEPSANTSDTTDTTDTNE